MKAKIRAFLCFVLTMVMMLSLAATASEASAGELYVSGVKVDGSNAADVLGNGKVRFDAEHAVLTLSDAYLTGTYEYQPYYEAVIWSTYPELTIECEGTNTIAPASEYGDGIDAAGGCDVIITTADMADSPATLMINNAYYGTYIGSWEIPGGDLTVSDIGIYVNDSQCAGIWVNHDLTVTDGDLNVNRSADFYTGIVSNTGSILFDGAFIFIDNKAPAIHMGNGDSSEHRLTVVDSFVNLSSASSGINSEDYNNGGEYEIRTTIEFLSGTVSIDAGKFALSHGAGPDSDFMQFPSDRVILGDEMLLPEGTTDGPELHISSLYRDPVEQLFGEETMIRSSGKGRYDTAIATAANLKKAMEMDNFFSVIIASGSGSGNTGRFPDALAGSYLSYIMGAPILMVGDKGEDLDKVKAFVENNLDKTFGRIYILGGTGAVPASVEEAFADYDVKRLSGKSRYETNLAILDEAGIFDGMDLIVADGGGFADALSASALGMPILLIDKKSGALTADQEALVSSTNFGNIYIIGGTGAVPASIEDQLKALKPGLNVERIKGANRYATSVALAEKFFPNTKCITVATGKNFPDGLTGGPLSFALGAPLILTEDTKSAYDLAAQYARAAGAQKYLVFGGSGSVPDSVIGAIMGK
ncbi:MAG: cell wall-binding repeat-containing protein [Lachnospiraceae bacterium]|nr:cell wall-binding repeat-containing protein [Lachnospiraceae bacterium]